MHQCIHPPIHPPIHPSMHQCIHPPIHPPIHPSMHQCIHPPIQHTVLLYKTMMWIISRFRIHRVVSWMDGCIDGLMDALMDGWMDGWICMYGLVLNWLTYIKVRPECPTQPSGDSFWKVYQLSFVNIIWVWSFSRALGPDFYISQPVENQAIHTYSPIQATHTTHIHTKTLTYQRYPAYCIII